MAEMISIIVPCYNQAQFLDETLQSVLNQTYKNWECIIVNDGSTDDSESIALKWVKKDSRFKYAKKQNGGLSSARNFGIEMANYDLILPLDSDDLLHEDLLLEVVPQFAEHNANVVHYDVEFFGAKEGKYILPKYSYKSLLLRNLFIACTPFKRELYLKVGGYDEQLKSFEDWDLWIRMLNENSKVVKIEKTLYYYRKHGEGSLTNTFSKKPKVYFDLYDYVYTKNKSIYDAHFKNPILAFQENEQLKAFNDKVKKNILFKVFEKLNKLF